jgi:hypothetical protein
MANQLISTKKLPSVGNPGSVYFCTATKLAYIALGDGTLFQLDGLLSMQPGQPAVGPQGEPGQSIVGPQGPKGDSIIGPRGPQGPAGQSIVGPKGADGRDGDRGKPGRDGRDSTVPGPKGDSIVGPAGPQGPRGDLFIPTETELQNAVIAYRQKYTRLQAVLLEGIAKSKNLPASTRLHMQNFITKIKAEAGL